MAKNVYIGGSFSKIDYSSSSHMEQIKLGELTIALVSVDPILYNDSITPVWNDSLGKFVFPDGVTTTLVSSGQDWFNYVENNAGYSNFVSFAIPTENPNAYYSYEAENSGVETRGKYTHSFAEDVARKVKSIYVGVDGVARKIKKVYIGDENRLARLCYEFNPSYLTFSSPSSFTLKVYDTTKHWDGTLEYSTDTSTWSTWDGTTTLSSATSGSDNVLYLRGTGNTVITGDSGGYSWILTGSDIACFGNIETLLDYATVETGAHPTMANYCYAHMFENCARLTQAPALPATTLADYCYDTMFYRCTSLTQVPALPATTLAAYCYRTMFEMCTALTQAPALPAITLKEYCYSGMFYGCTSLTQAPALPATTLADYCYHSMFYGCTSLTQAPALPATTLAAHCYTNMFIGCTALTQAPALPATTLAGYCYHSMFRGCTSLTQAPALPATTLKEYCYYGMFTGCTSLTQAPALPATTLADSCYFGMFQNCTSLTQAPALPATTLSNSCCISMFKGCTSLIQAPSLPATTLATRCYYGMFDGCTGLTQAPELPATTLVSECYRSMFHKCTSLTKAPDKLPATTLASNCYRFMFEFTAITAIPRIMATTYATDSCKGMFDDIKTLNVYSSSGPGHTYGWTAPASTYCSGMFGSDDKQSEWAKLDGSNFPNSGTPTEGVTYYFATVD